MRTVAIFILTTPLLFLAFAWTLLVAPLLMIFIIPLWGVMDLVCVLRGEKSMLFPALVFVFLMGFEMYGCATGFYELDLI